MKRTLGRLRAAAVGLGLFAVAAVSKAALITGTFMGKIYERRWSGWMFPDVDYPDRTFQSVGTFSFGLTTWVD